ncbi:glycosyltransferase, partial [Bacteroidota bacterium]
GDRVASYKNFNMAVETSRMVNMPLVIVGGGELTVLEKSFLDQELNNKYCSLIGVSNKILNVLYSNAFCFLYPSLYEGFGLPIVEAQNSGCPIITSSVSSLPEVTGKGGVLIDNINSSKMSEVVRYFRWIRKWETFFMGFML